MSDDLCVRDSAVTGTLRRCNRLRSEHCGVIHCQRKQRLAGLPPCGLAHHPFYEPSRKATRPSITEEKIEAAGEALFLRLFGQTSPENDDGLRKTINDLLRKHLIGEVK